MAICDTHITKKISQMIFSLTKYGAGNGKPLQCSCLESPVDCCPQGCIESDTTEATKHACMHRRRKWQPTPVFLLGESQGWRSLVGCRLWGRTESDTTEVIQQQQVWCVLFSYHVIKKCWCLPSRISTNEYWLEVCKIARWSVFFIVVIECQGD